MTKAQAAIDDINRAETKRLNAQIAGIIADLKMNPNAALIGLAASLISQASVVGFCDYSLSTVQNAYDQGVANNTKSTPGVEATPSAEFLLEAWATLKKDPIIAAAVVSSQALNSNPQINAIAQQLAHPQFNGSRSGLIQDNAQKLHHNKTHRAHIGNIIELAADKDKVAQIKQLHVQTLARLSYDKNDNENLVAPNPFTKQLEKQAEEVGVLNDHNDLVHTAFRKHLHQHKMDHNTELHVFKLDHRNHAALMDLVTELLLEREVNKEIIKFPERFNVKEKDLGTFTPTATDAGNKHNVNLDILFKR